MDLRAQAFRKPLPGKEQQHSRALCGRQLPLGSADGPGLGFFSGLMRRLARASRFSVQGGGIRSIARFPLAIIFGDFDDKPGTRSFPDLGKSTASTISTTGTSLPKKETAMKSKLTSLVLGICLAILAGATSPAYARSTTGYSAFKVQQGKANQYGSKNPYSCITEFYGEVVNYCPYNVYMEFDLPIDTDGSFQVSVQNLSFDSRNTFNCTLGSYTGNGSLGYQKVTFQFLGTGGAHQTKTVDISAVAGGTIQLVCNVPGNNSGGLSGIADINWNPN
jgi:hypothetical protein